MKKYIIKTTITGQTSFRYVGKC